MGLDSGAELCDYKKINKDISRISCDAMSKKQIEDSLLRIVDRTSSVYAFVSKNGLEVKGVSIFTPIEESEFFLLYFSVRRLLLEKESNDEHIAHKCLMNKIQTILVNQYFPVVLHWAGHSPFIGYQNRHTLSASDRTSEGSVVLVKCVNKFDFSRGVRFISYVLGSLYNVLTKDYRDRKNDIKSLSFLPSHFEDIDSLVPVIKKIESKNDSLLLTEIKNIFDGCINDSDAASFLSPVEKSIICLEFNDSFSEEDRHGSQVCRAKELNINIDFYRRKKKSAFDKIKEVTISRMSGRKS